MDARLGMMADTDAGTLDRPAKAAATGTVRCAIGIAAALALGLAGGSALAQGPKRIAGLASYYGKDYHGRLATGGHYDPRKFTAAHRSLPFGTHLRVTNPRTKRSVTVVVNDRGPFIRGRVLDLSFAAAQALHMTGRGVTRVVAEVQ